MFVLLAEDERRGRGATGGRNTSASSDAERGKSRLRRPKSPTAEEFSPEGFLPPGGSSCNITPKTLCTTEETESDCVGWRMWLLQIKISAQWASEFIVTSPSSIVNEKDLVRLLKNLSSISPSFSPELAFRPPSSFLFSFSYDAHLPHYPLYDVNQMPHILSQLSLPQLLSPPLWRCAVREEVKFISSPPRTPTCGISPWRAASFDEFDASPLRDTSSSLSPNVNRTSALSPLSPETITRDQYFPFSFTTSLLPNTKPTAKSSKLLSRTYSNGGKRVEISSRRSFDTSTTAPDDTLPPGVISGSSEKMAAVTRETVGDSPTRRSSVGMMELAEAAAEDEDRIIELAKLLPAKANVWSLSILPPRATLEQLTTSWNGEKMLHKGDGQDETGPPPPLELARTPDKSFLENPHAMPLLVFVNAKSGGQAGADLLKELFAHLNPIQVIDIQAEKGPTRALEQFRPLALTNKLRILVCGGDGTVSWVMNDIHRIYGSASEVYVPLGLLPLGTGNDLSRVLGWGVSYDNNIYRWLEQVMLSQSSVLDVWKYSVEELKTGQEIKSGSFNNYLDVGIAARIALKFHQLRETHPELFQSRLGNKFLFGEVGFKDFFGERSMVLEGVRLWCDGVEMPLGNVSLAGIIVSNIPSFAGGVNLWGDPTLENLGSVVSRYRKISGGGYRTHPHKSSWYYHRGRRPPITSSCKPSNPLYTPAGCSPLNGSPRCRKSSHHRHQHQHLRPLLSDFPFPQDSTSSKTASGQKRTDEHHSASPNLPQQFKIRRDSTLSLRDRRVFGSSSPDRVLSVLRTDQNSPHRSAKRRSGRIRKRRPIHWSYSSEDGTSEERFVRPFTTGGPPSCHRPKTSNSKKRTTPYIVIDSSQSENDSTQRRRRTSASRLLHHQSKHMHHRPNRRSSIYSADLYGDPSQESSRYPVHSTTPKRKSTVMGGISTVWKKQSPKDQLIEIVAVRSLFHLGQIQVGLAEPVRVGQGREVVLDIPTDKVPLQVDGEPCLLSSFRIRISHKCESIVLTPHHGSPIESMRLAHQVLDEAVSDGLISNYQRNCLLKEFSKKS